MKQAPILSSMLLAGVASLFLSGCVVRERVVYRPPPAPVVVTPVVIPNEVVVSAPPPPPVQETVVVAPGPGYYWVRGAWVWRDRWVWERGHWVYPPRPGARWRESHYEVRNGVRIYVRGGWAF
jgi:hypothetical protein